jgi:citrate synthase
VRGDDTGSEWLTTREAADLLGVKPATLYSYVSRGLLRRVPASDGRRSRYRRADVLAWKARHDARRGHGPVAAAAMHYGEPVLDTRVADIGPQGPRYRGRPATALVAEGVSFEAAAEWLWSGELPEVAPCWEGQPAPSPLDGPPRSIAELGLLVAWMALSDPLREVRGMELELARARRVLLCLVDAFAPGRDLRSPPGLAAGLARAWGVRSRKAPALIDAALVLSMDHGQSASTFAARVAAGTGADLYACLQAALAALSGPRHGGACDRIEALVGEVVRSGDAARVLRARLGRGEEVPGFGHRLYPGGDPRTGPLLAGARALGRPAAASRALEEVVTVMEDWGQPAPALDLGLVAVALGLRLPPGAAGLLFALGRVAGWVAHVLEQRESGQLLRPRGRYVGEGTPVPGV